jgi:hypothetical protein
MEATTMGIADRRNGLVPSRSPRIRFIPGQFVRSRAAGFLLMFLISPAFGTEDVAPQQGRPGVLRFGDLCFQGELFIGPKVACEDRSADSEKIAGFESTFKMNLENGSPGAKADWEAWQTTAGIASFDAREKAWEAELEKQAAQHADLSAPFITPLCLPTYLPEKNKNLERECKHDRISFQRSYWLALQGDHKAQRFVASCFGLPSDTVNGIWACHGVVRPDEVMQCAWLLVAMSSAHPESAKAADEYGWLYECDRKPGYKRQATLGTASELFLRIYHRPLPLAR